MFCSHVGHIGHCCPILELSFPALRWLLLGPPAGSVVLGSSVTPPPVLPQTAAAPSGPVPPPSHLETYIGHASFPVPCSHGRHHFIMLVNYCSFVAFFFFSLSPFPAPSSCHESPDSPVSLLCVCRLHTSLLSPRPAWLMQQPWMEPPPSPPTPLPPRLKLPQTPSASCLTSPKPPFIPFLPSGFLRVTGHMMQ